LVAPALAAMTASRANAPVPMSRTVLFGARAWEKPQQRFPLLALSAAGSTAVVHGKRTEGYRDCLCICSSSCFVLKHEPILTVSQTLLSGK
jgi:hypothetical protein